MLAINNQELFNTIVKESLAKAVNYPRWVNAINKAVTYIQLQPEFITWMPDTKSIVIWNQKSNAVHSANGVCDCFAFQKGFPCFHRALARLVRLYMEASAPREDEIETFIMTDNEQMRDPLIRQMVKNHEDSHAFYYKPEPKGEKVGGSFRI